MCDFFGEFRRFFCCGLHEFSRSCGLHQICSPHLCTSEHILFVIEGYVCEVYNRYICTGVCTMYMTSNEGDVVYNLLDTLLKKWVSLIVAYVPIVLVYRN